MIPRSSIRLSCLLRKVRPRLDQSFVGGEGSLFNFQKLQNQTSKRASIVQQWANARNRERRLWNVIIPSARAIGRHLWPVKFTMSLTCPFDRCTRHMLGHFASGLIPMTSHSAVRLCIIGK